jgi:hypothetical protein
MVSKLASSGLLLAICLAAAANVQAEQISVRHQQGSAHGFVEVVDGGGKRIGIGDLLQRAHGSLVRSELSLRFLDGSVDDEVTLYSQHGVFRFISDRHLQKGPSFPKAVDVTIDAQKNLVTSVNPDGQRKEVHMDMPADAYSGMTTTLLMNLPSQPPVTDIAVIAGGDTPRLVHLAIKRVGAVPFTLGGQRRAATDFDVHIELGGVAGVVAPMIDKQPADYRVLIVEGADPAFIRMQGQLFEGAPLWTIQQVSARFSGADTGN